MLASSLTWLPSGASKSLPDVYEPAENEPEPAPEPMEVAVATHTPIEATDDDIVMQYGLDTYDDEDNEAPLFAGGPKNLMAFKNNEEDPYITLPPEEDDDDLEDFIIRNSDLVMLTAVTEEDQLSHLDVVVLPEALTHYSKDQSEETLRAAAPEPYVHHDYLLPAFPLTVQWLGIPSTETETGLVNLAAVGTFEPNIELWDLDVVDTPAPSYVLSGHSGAVISLHAHPSPQLRNLLASGSADSTVKLWDVSRANTVAETVSESSACLQNVSVHGSADKVQAVRWHPSDPSVVCSASIGPNHAVVIQDIRQDISSALRHSLVSDAETLTWLDAQRLLISTEDGEVLCFNVAAGKLEWRLDAHNGPCAGLSLSALPNTSSLVPILATCSPSKQAPLKLWVLSPNGGPRCVFSKTDSLGKLFTAAFSFDLPFILACGGQSPTPHFVNILEYTPMYRLWTGQDSVSSLVGHSAPQADSLFEEPASRPASSKKSKKKNSKRS